MIWRLPRRTWLTGKGTKNKRAFKTIVKSGEIPGILGYLGKRPIAWCALAPRQQYLSLARSRVLKPVDDKSVWSISCLFILKPYRRQGISIPLLQAAVEFAAKQGARIVEGYPIEPATERMPDPFVWTGIVSAFTKAGFKEAERRSKTRPIMRYEIL